jgi:TrpR-related protein YerC/YecD
MKRRAVQPENSDTSSLDFLCEAMVSMRTVEEMRAFLRDLTTPAELEALTDRWRVVPYLLREVAYREIHDRTAVSVTTIGRVARFLVGEQGGYALAAKRLQRKGRWPPLETD